MKRVPFVLSIFLLTLSLNVWAAGSGKLVELIVSESGLVEMLSKRGVEGASANRVEGYVRSSLLSLNRNSKPSPAQLKKVLIELKEVRIDSKYKRQLLSLLDKDVDSLSKKDLVDAVNNLIYIANRYGYRKGTLLACAECVSDTLGRHGFKFTLEEVSDSNVRQVLESMIPRTPQEVTKKISQWMGRSKAGDFSRTSRKLVAREERKTLAVFLAMAQKSSPASRTQKEFIDAVMDVSKRPGGSVKLLDPDNPHKLWKLFDNQSLSEDLLREWTAVLRETAEVAKNDVSKKEAFFKVLKKRAGDDPVLQEQVNALRVKGCYFK